MFILLGASLEIMGPGLQDVLLYSSLGLEHSSTTYDTGWVDTTHTAHDPGHDPSSTRFSGPSSTTSQRAVHTIDTCWPGAANKVKSRDNVNARHSANLSDYVDLANNFPA